MTRQRLTNERWGFSTNCFVCEPTNPDGLRLPFFHDTGRGVVTASFALGDAFSGAPSYVHGGVSMAVVDEAQSWATIAIGGKFAVTTHAEVDFLRPVRIGREYTVEAELVDGDDETMATVARILDHEGSVRVRGRASFQILSPAMAVDAIGEVTGDDEAFLRGTS